MADWPLIEAQRLVSVGANLATSRYVTATAGAPANTKGAYAELIAATAAPASGLLIMLKAPSYATPYLVDIGIGGVGSEQVLVPNLLNSYLYGISTLFVPVEVAVGSRLSAKCQAPSSSQPIDVGIITLSQGFLPSQPLARVTDCGTDLANSRGTEVVCASINTKGAWAQLVAATAHEGQWLLVSAYGSSSNNGLFDIGVGAVGDEEVVLPDLQAPSYYAGCEYSLPLHIPAGTRLSARWQCDTYPASIYTIAYIMG